MIACFDSCKFEFELFLWRKNCLIKVYIPYHTIYDCITCNSFMEDFTHQILNFAYL